MLALLEHDIRLVLLQTARDAIRALIAGQSYTPPVLTDPPIASGVFVTLHVSGALRGCIGFLEIEDSLLHTLAEAARRAASRDPRFMPIEKSELDDCRIEVTLLGPRERISDPMDFDIGRHGLVLEYEGRRGLLLPQVPVERGWDRTEFLSALCLKTRVPDQSWMRAGAVLFRFEGLVIREDDHVDS